MTSGAIQKGVPTNVLRLLVVAVSWPATPKSASFTRPASDSRTLAAAEGSHEMKATVATRTQSSTPLYSRSQQASTLHDATQRAMTSGAKYSNHYDMTHTTLPLRRAASSEKI